jgi:hypothetical protein
VDRGEYQERLGHRLCELDVVDLQESGPSCARVPLLTRAGSLRQDPCAGGNGKIA